MMLAACAVLLCGLETQSIWYPRYLLVHQLLFQVTDDIRGNAPDSNSSKTFRFVCTARRVAAMINVLVNGSEAAYTECAMGTGAFTVTRERVKMGARFSWPHLRTGLMGVLVAAPGQVADYDRWVRVAHHACYAKLALLKTGYTAFACCWFILCTRRNPHCSCCCS